MAADENTVELSLAWRAGDRRNMGTFQAKAFNRRKKGTDYVYTAIPEKFLHGWYRLVSEKEKTELLFSIDDFPTEIQHEIERIIGSEFTLNAKAVELGIPSYI